MSTSDNSKTRVLVTGASGYIATHVIQQLLKQGYLVRGTVRSLQNEKKIAPLKELYPPAKNNLELVEADLLDSTAWKKPVEGCKYIIHVASPFPSVDPTDPNDLIRPAVEGTMAVLRAAQEAGCVKRIVLTSSSAAILGEGRGDKPLNEENWTKMDDNVNTYFKSKMLAEKAAWDFVKEHPNLELSVMNPGYVLGPMLHDSDCTSSEMVIRILNLKDPMLPQVWFTGIDVRDVAEAHVKAMVLPEAAGQRFALGESLISFVDMAEILKKEFGPQGYWISTWPAPYWGVWLFSFFDPSARMILRDVGRKFHVDSTKMRTVLGIKPIDVKKSIIEMAYSVIERGLVKKTKGYKGPPGVSS